MKKVIDVSAYQGHINWEQVKNEGYDTAILRLGIGDDYSKQDDIKLNEYIEGCNRFGIQYGFYLVCYAQRLNGSESVESEIKHTERLIQGKNPFAIFYDVEVDSIEHLGKETITNFCDVYCKYFKDKGYNVGVYANKNWFTNYIDYEFIKSKGYLIWLAHYGVDKPSLDCDIWQYSESGHLQGIGTNTTDLNILYNESILNGSSIPTPIKKENNIHYQVWDDIKNEWLPNVINDTDYAGIFGHDVCCVYANLDYGDVRYLVHTKGKDWLPVVVNRGDYAGIFNKPIDGFAIHSSVKQLTYRVHLRRDNRWLPWVSGYDISNSKSGYAGILGQEIDAIQIK